MKMLPTKFQDLQYLVADWALPTEKARHLKMLSVSISDLRLFYNAILPRMEAIKDCLDALPLGALPADAQTLLDLALTFVETAHPIDLGWKTTDIEDAFPAERFIYRVPSC